MKGRYLEVTFVRGKPLTAYLYLPHALGEPPASTVDAGHGLRVDLDGQGAPMGIEISEPGAVNRAQLNEVLARHGVPPLDDAEWAPLGAARGSLSSPL